MDHFVHCTAAPLACSLQISVVVKISNQHYFSYHYYLLIYCYFDIFALYIHECAIYGIAVCANSEKNMYLAAYAYFKIKITKQTVNNRWFCQNLNVNKYCIATKMTTLHQLK